MERVNPVTGEIRKVLDEHGHEVPDDTPVVLPAGFRRPETLAERVQRLVRTEVSRRAEAEGFESFEEAEDFDVEDEIDPSTPYETFFDPVLGKELTPFDFKRNEAEYRRQYLSAQEAYFRQMDQLEAVERPRSNAEPRGTRTARAVEPEAPAQEESSSSE